MIRERRYSPSDDAAHLPEAPSASGFSADDRLEMAIEATRQAMLAAHTSHMKRELAAQMKALIGQRSPWQIAKMEQERGLA